MRTTNLIRIAAVALSLSAVAPAAFARQTYDYATDSWPQIQAQVATQNEKTVAQAHSNTATDATNARPQRVAPQQNGLTLLGQYGGQF